MAFIFVFFFSYKARNPVGLLKFLVFIEILSTQFLWVGVISFPAFGISCNESCHHCFPAVKTSFTVHCTFTLENANREQVFHAENENTSQSESIRLESRACRRDKHINLSHDSRQTFFQDHLMQQTEIELSDVLFINFFISDDKNDQSDLWWRRSDTHSVSPNCVCRSP